MKLTIDTDQIGELVQQSEGLILTPNAEVGLVKLLQLQADIELALSTAKELIAKKALEVDPQFTTIRGDLVSASYQAYGAKYKVDQSKIELLPAELVKQKITYSVDTDGLEKWLETHDGLPDGIDPAVREKHLVIRQRKAKALHE